MIRAVCKLLERGESFIHVTGITILIVCLANKSPKVDVNDSYMVFMDTWFQEIEIILFGMFVMLWIIATKVSKLLSNVVITYTDTPKKNTRTRLCSLSPNKEE